MDGVGNSEDHETWFSIESVPFLSCSHQFPLKKMYIYTYFRGQSWQVETKPGWL